ncbi:M1 family metallopeptidase [Candidatus Saccharibacteria bacterium]|nr:M1 family metallopeptidase [Candidatus Saccharibacteria bacterium]
MERLLECFRPEKYVLDIKVNKGQKSIGGKVVVTGEALRENVKFHAVDLNITGVEVGGTKAEFDADGEILEVKKVPIGEAEITIYYNGKLNENMQGAYLSTYEYKGKTETIVATQFESHYAREAFPCIDEPAAKAVFELSLTVPEKDLKVGDLVLANMPVKNVVKNTTVFEPTPRMSTYLLAWVIGKFHGKTVKNTHGTEITTYCTLAQDLDSVDFANEVAAKSLEFYDDNFKVPYPLKKCDQVALPDFEAGAMENWGLVTYRESMMLAGKTATVETRKEVALTVAHELSHQWFGDLVTMEWWDDLWLNESFASVMEYYAVDNIYPEYQIFEEFFVGKCLMALMRDAYSDVQSVHQEVASPEEIATLFDGAIVYAKGAHLMLMLIRLMGWDDFCKGCRDYFEKYQYANTVGNDLWKCLSKYAEFDTKKLMHAFIDWPGYPVITSVDGAFDDFKQKRFLLDSDKMPESDWPLPEVTEDMSGHYVLNLSDAEFMARLEDFGKLGLEEKLRLLIDRSLVCRTDLASSDSLVSLVMKFKDESSAAVWNIVMTIVGQLRIFFEPGSDEEKRFKKFTKELVAPKLKEIGLTTRKSDDENILRLRAILLGLDYYGSTFEGADGEVIENLQKLAKMYEADYAALDPEMRDSILCAKIYLEPEYFDDYLRAYRETEDPEIKFDLLTAMTLVKDERNVKKMVDLLGKLDVVKLQNQTQLFVRLYRNSYARALAFAWLVDNWDWLVKTMGDKSLDAYPRYTANIVRTEDEFKAWREFFLPMQDNMALKRAIEIGEKEIAARLKLIKKDRETVIKKVEA